MEYSQPAEMQLMFSIGAWLRRSAEQAIAAAALALMIIPFGLAVLVIRWVLGRPILFSQTRVGLNLRPFTIQKLRTLHDVRDASGNLLPDRLREATATRIMRRIRVDEIPQLLAIVRGHMSFIGPRPLLPSTIRDMGELGRLRCLVRPGLSGWAQVNGNTRLSDAQKLALDIWYVDHKSFCIDLLIVMQTLITIVRGERVNQRRLAEAETYVAARYTSPLPTISGQSA